MLQDAQRTSAPSARSVSISTAVWIVMCSDPAMRAPLSGWRGPYSARVAIRPGISVSAMAISLRPQSARPMSLTTKSELAVLAAVAEAECTRCPLYKSATQVVPGEGRVRAHLMLVGEQPGDKEDLAGKPFVGPAGRILDQALEEAGIARNDAFVTNAVKHFKFEQRGKRRLHKKPNAYEIERCKWWLDQERAIVKPTAIVALGAS